MFDCQSCRDPKRLFYGPDHCSLCTNIGELALRIFAGLSLAFAHGWGKIPPSEGFVEGVGGLGFPLPLLFAWAAGLSEFLGGILLALGFATRPAAFFIFFTMMVAGLGQHWDDPYRMKELALLFGAVGFYFMITGAGRFSVDACIRSRWSKPEQG